MKSTDNRPILNAINPSRWVSPAILTAVLIAPGVYSDPVAPSADMHIKPKLCVRGTSAEQCQLNVTITWRGNSAGEYCLYSDQSLQPLRCWVQQTRGNTKDDVSITQDLDYWLAWQLDNDELARRTLKVLTAKSDDRRRARRRRLVWSVF